MRFMNAAKAGQSNSVDPPPVAPGTERHVALALVNTRTIRSGSEVDELPDTHAARAWLTSAGLLRPRASVRKDTTDRLIGLRESVRALFAALVDGDVPEPATLSVLNEALTAAPVADELHWDEKNRQPTRVVSVQGATPVDAALADIARDCVDLLVGPDAVTLSACGAPDCIRFYLRTHAARQWCSTRCGDRVRAARHYARRRTLRT